MDRPTPIAALLPDEIAHAFELPASFRALQVFQWIWKGATSFDMMSDVSKEVRERLKAGAILRKGTVMARLNDGEGNKKIQVRFPAEESGGAGDAVEAVLLSHYRNADGEKPPRYTACLSSQSGCAMACKFCKTGRLGFRRSLESAEILEEFLLLEDAAGVPLDNVVFMGMGEPLANLTAVRRAINVLSHPKGRALSLRRITISTAGLIDGIRSLAADGPHLRLAVSLTAADETLRSDLMPIACSNPLPDLKEAICDYAAKSKRRLTLEAVLLHGINTSPPLARAFATFARDTSAHVNLIPWNRFQVDDASLLPDTPFEEPSVKECRTFQNILETAGVSVTLRLRRASSIAGACGQLGL